MTAATDDDPAAPRIAHGVRDEIRHDALEQQRVAVDPHPARNNTEPEPLLPGGLHELVFHPAEQALHGKVGAFGRYGARVKARDVEQRIEQVADRRHGSIDAVDEPALLGQQRFAAQLRNEESKRVHRLAQIVARGSQKARFCLVGERELPGALFDFLLQLFMRLTEAPGHGVELIREHLKLVSGLNAHAMIEPAGGQLHGPGFKGLHRGSDSPRDHERAQRGQDERQRGNDAQTSQARVDRRVGLRDRLLNDHRPPGRRHRRGCCDNVRPGVVLREHRAVPRADLRELREIAVLQNEFEIGMGDQPAAAVDDVGVPRAPEFDARHAFPYELQVDVGERDRFRTPARRDRDAGIRLRPLAKVNGTEVKRPCAGCDKARVVRMIGSRCDHVELRSRHEEFLAAEPVELTDIRDCRDLLQQIAVFETTLQQRLLAQVAHGQ